jgi:hypothetical protein
MVHRAGGAIVAFRARDMCSRRRRLAACLAWITLTAVTGWMTPNAMAARQAARPAASSGRTQSSASARRRARTRALTPRQQAFKQHLLQHLYWWGLPEPTPRVRLTRKGGSEESFTVSDRSHLLRGRVYENQGGIGVLVHEAFERVDGKWVPTENPVDDKNRLGP